MKWYLPWYPLKSLIRYMSRNIMEHCCANPQQAIKIFENSWELFLPPLEVWRICQMFCWNRLLGLLWSTYTSLIKARDGPHFASSSQLNFAPLLGNHTAAISRNRIQVLGNRTLEEHEIVITLIKNDYCEWYSFHYWKFWFHKHEWIWVARCLRYLHTRCRWFLLHYLYFYTTFKCG